MQSGLQKRIKNYLDATGLSVSSLEKKAGLKTNVARNILTGQSKKPGAVTLQAIADVIGCSVQDLLGVRKKFHQVEPTIRFDESPVVDNVDLLKEAFQCILNVAAENKYDLTVQQICLILEEVYSYTSKKTPPKIERHFVEWYMKKVIR